MNNIDKDKFIVYTRWVQLQCLTGKLSYQEGIKFIGEVHKTNTYHSEFERELNIRGVY